MMTFTSSITFSVSKYLIILGYCILVVGKIHTKFLYLFLECLIKFINSGKI